MYTIFALPRFPKQGPRNRLCRAAGAAAPSGGRELRKANNRGGDNPSMKILFDFLPIALFFGMFKYAESNKDWAAATATEWLGFMVSGGVDRKSTRLNSSHQ